MSNERNWWSTVEELKRVGVAYAMDGVQLLPNGDLADIDIGRATDLANQHPDTRRICVWAAEWSRLAFPTVQMPHKYAAALMCTAVPPLDDEDIKPPWPYFLVNVPNGLLPMVNDDGARFEVDRIMCVHYEGRWSVHALTRDVMLSMPWKSTAFMREVHPNPNAVEHAFDKHQEALVGCDERVLFCIGRLILNLSIAFSDPSNVRQIGKGHSRTRGSNPSDRVPDLTQLIFELGKPVVVDCREHLRAYVLGDRAKLAVRVLVRGFWRNQPHGPASSLRRRQWIEPYWKGDVGSPILTRPHDLQRTSGVVPR